MNDLMKLFFSTRPMHGWATKTDNLKNKTVSQSQCEVVGLVHDS